MSNTGECSLRFSQKTCYNMQTGNKPEYDFGELLFEKKQHLGDCTVSGRLANTFSARLS